MDKYAADKKLEAVLRYLNGKESYRESGKCTTAIVKQTIKSYLFLITITEYKRNETTSRRFITSND